MPKCAHTTHTAAEEDAKRTDPTANLKAEKSRRKTYYNHTERDRGPCFDSQAERKPEDADAMKIAVVLMVLSVAAIFDRCAEAFLPCVPCVDGNCEEPEECQHGIAVDICGRKVCAKGPGQRCGGKWNLLGNCGDGMFCHCNRCSGCSLATLECYTPKCV